MPKETDQNFINWVKNYVFENSGVTASDILNAYKAQLKPYDNDLYDAEKKKSNVNSALYQLLGKEEVTKHDPEEGKLAPIWKYSDGISDDQ